ncbi:E3 ubiquitin-protein ligase RHF1A-like [Malus domestica]|uniref:E3 ubiquitin-protein ligase RHF1A-like n=1 Tax=Malus domestica TaxID=3750 RepID=UPI00049915D2|nr:E3 ubiquitin-protein ligase RHF1A-like [Malus domestica]
MASLAPSSSLNPKPVSAAPSSSPDLLDDSNEDSCSICLEPFNCDDPATITSCKHEYHLHCILEWSQRSKECPICWQLFSLKDPACQGLLTAIQNERNSRSRKTSSMAPQTYHSSEDFDVEHESFSDDSDLDERIMQHLAAASSRARYARRRERQRSSGLGPSHVFVFSNHENVPGFQQTYPISPKDSPTSQRPSVIQSPPSFICSTAANSDIPYKPRVLYGRPSPDGPHRPSPSETINLPDSIKSTLSAASARYKESISRSTRGFKEKLLARNNSVKELSKGVQREMNAGIAGVARMFERFDLTPKKPGAPTPVSGPSGGGTSNLSFKGKGVLETVIVHSCNNNGRVGDESSDAPSGVKAATADRVEVSSAQSGH